MPNHSILLHVCCAPCLIFPLRTLKAKGFQVEGLFFNPNIHPLSEHKKRKKEIEDYSSAEGFKITFADYEPQDFFRAVNMMEVKLERCPICWFQRLSFTAQQAKTAGFSHFSTTLLVSPYQDQDLLRKIGGDIAASEDLSFYYEDFRPGFRSAHEEARKKGIYCQTYCGCIYSEIERDATKKDG